MAAPALSFGASGPNCWLGGRAAPHAVANRVVVPGGSFADWLRHLLLKPGRTEVPYRGSFQNVPIRQVFSPGLSIW
jgi:hypothetical protein